MKYLILILFSLNLYSQSTVGIVASSVKKGCGEISNTTNLLILVGGQSNSGTDGAGAQNTGRVDYTDMPTYLQTAPANVDYLNVTGSTFTIQDWAVDPSLQWGYLNQTLYVLAQEYDDVIYAKRAVGGTTILPSNGGTYPRSDFISRALFAISAANTRWGSCNFNTVIIWNQGESNGIIEADALAYEQALTEWFSTIKSTVRDCNIFYNKMGGFQDQAFTYIIPEIQNAQEAVSLLDTAYRLVIGESDAKWLLQDLDGDVSHYAADGAITLGNNFADSILLVLGKVKSTSAPTLVSIECYEPTEIVLKYSGNLNEAVKPFWKDFTISGTRQVISTEVSADSVVLTISEPFYQPGTNFTLTYTPAITTENAIQDINGNNVAGFTNEEIDCTISPVSISYSNQYTSDFSAGLDGWSGFSGGDLAIVDGIGGEDDVLEIGNTDGTPQALRNSTLTGTSGHTYRLRFDIYVPFSYWGNGSPSPFAISTTYGPSNLIFTLYPLIRSFVLSQRWVTLEYTFTTADASTSLYFQSSGNIGQNYYLKNIIIDRIITP